MALTALVVPSTKRSWPTTGLGGVCSWKVLLTFRTLSPFSFCLSDTSESLQELLFLLLGLQRVLLLNFSHEFMNCDLPVRIRALNVTSVVPSSPRPSLWYLLMDTHLSAQAHQAWHQLFIHLSKPSLSPFFSAPGLPHPVLCYEHNDPRKYTSSEGGFLLQKSPLNDTGGIPMNMFLWPFLLLLYLGSRTDPYNCL